MSFEKGTLSVFLGPNFESARATGNRPYSFFQVRCYEKLKSYQPTSQHLTMWTFQHSCSLKCQVCSRLETSDFVMLSFTSNVKCSEFDVGSPLGVVTWCIFLQFGDESMWSGCHPRCTNPRTRCVLHETVVLCECPGCHWQGTLALLQVPRIQKHNFWDG